MDDNIKITKEEIKIKLEIELLELKKEISNILIPENKIKEENSEILDILQNREKMVRKRLEELEGDDF
jgi:predicted metal-binding transcription factor (methanogenesis marker protein 9)